MTRSYTKIRLEKESPAWRVVLNRPEVRNAHDLDMFKQLVRRVRRGRSGPQLSLHRFGGGRSGFSVPDRIWPSRERRAGTTGMNMGAGT